MVMDCGLPAAYGGLTGTEGNLDGRSAAGARRRQFRAAVLTWRGVSRSASHSNRTVLAMSANR